VALVEVDDVCPGLHHFFHAGGQVLAPMLQGRRAVDEVDLSVGVSEPQPPVDGVALVVPASLLQTSAEKLDGLLKAHVNAMGIEMQGDMEAKLPRSVDELARPVSRGVVGVAHVEAEVRNGPVLGDLAQQRLARVQHFRDALKLSDALSGQPPVQDAPAWTAISRKGSKDIVVIM
jgi:hypothetical protein